MSGFLKARTTSIMASTSRMWLKNLFPKPSPLCAPATSPAMSTNSMVVGTVFFDLYTLASCSSLSSGTLTTPTLGSMVQKGKLEAAACLRFKSALKVVDFPTLGKPTMPTEKDINQLLITNYQLQ